MSIKLSNGMEMPTVGLGCSVFPEPPEVVETSVETAIDIGYRHFDTATLYHTEFHLGNALKRALESGKVTREELFIVTKLPQTGMTPELVTRYMDKSLKDLQLEYVDLYLIHWPIGCPFTGDLDNNIPRDEQGNILFTESTDFESVWKEMEKQVESGKARAIGLSNFNEKQVDRILKIAKIPPVCNQVELHAYLQQQKFNEFCASRGIALTAYYPIGGQSRKDYPKYLQITEMPKLLEDPVVLDLAKKYGKTPGQILLRFLTQLGNISVIPKSSNPSRQLDNLKILEFTLSPEDVASMKTLDKGESGRSCFNWPGCQLHPEYPFSHSNFLQPPS